MASTAIHDTAVLHHHDNHGHDHGHHKETFINIFLVRITR